MSAVVKAMQRARVSVALENWLKWNGVDPTALLDCELLEVAPDCVRAELEGTLRLQQEFERKWQAAQGTSRL
jgi:hypothetical protein